MNNIKKLFAELSAKGTDFAASTYAFMERQGTDMSSIDIDDMITKEERPFFYERLEHYRNIYKKIIKSRTPLDDPEKHSEIV